MGNIQGASMATEKKRTARVVQAKNAEKSALRWQTAIKSIRQQWFIVAASLMGVMIMFAFTLGGLHGGAQTKRGSSTKYLSTTNTLRASVQEARVRVYRVFPPDVGLMLPEVDGGGNVWFGEMTTNKLARLDPGTGVVKTWIPPGGEYGIMAICIDGSGNVWFTEQNANYIAVFHPANQTFKTFGFSNGKKERVGLQDLQFDASGKLWFTELTGRRIGRLDPASGRVQTWDVPDAAGGTAAYPFGLSITHDGQVWFGTYAGGVVGHLDPTSGHIKLYALADPREQIYAMAEDERGHIWFTELQFGRLGMIDTMTGKVTELNVPRTLGNPEDLHSIVVAPGGDVWFTSSGTNTLVRYAPGNSTFTFFKLPLPYSGLFGLGLETNDGCGSQPAEVSRPIMLE